MISQIFESHALARLSTWPKEDLMPWLSKGIDLSRLPRENRDSDAFMPLPELDYKSPACQIAQSSRTIPALYAAIRELFCDLTTMPVEDHLIRDDVSDIGYHGEWARYPRLYAIHFIADVMNSAPDPESYGLLTAFMESDVMCQIGNELEIRNPVFFKDFMAIMNEHWNNLAHEVARQAAKNFLPVCASVPALRVESAPYPST